MTGLLEWSAEKRLQYETKEIFGLRFFCALVPKGARTPELILRRRCRRALKKMAAQGIRQVILPEDFQDVSLLEQTGVQRVSAFPLRQRLASDWVACVLAEQGKSGTRITVSAEHLTAAVVRTITELVLRYRYLLLELPYGGEELCHSLRREYGVSPQLNPERAALEAAEVWVAFDPVAGKVNPPCRVLPLYDESVALPQMLLPPLLENQIPKGVCREQLLSVLQEAGRLPYGQIIFEKRKNLDIPMENLYNIRL